MPQECSSHIKDINLWSIIHCKYCYLVCHLLFSLMLVFVIQKLLVVHIQTFHLFLCDFSLRCMFMLPKSWIHLYFLLVLLFLLFTVLLSNLNSAPYQLCDLRQVLGFLISKSGIIAATLLGRWYDLTRQDR